MGAPKPSRLLSKDGSVQITDEICNTLISSLGAALSAIGSAVLVYRAWAAGDFRQLLGFSIYGLGLTAMFAASALHHGVNGSPRTNHLLRQFDYYAIFIMIAGSFTPFCLILLRDRWFVLGLVWALAITGIIVKALFPHVSRWVMLSIYIGMGWLGLLIAGPIYRAIPWQGFLMFLLGGLFFTVGGVIYGIEKPNPIPGRFGFHEIWHSFVLAGAASHFYVIFGLASLVVL